MFKKCSCFFIYGLFFIASCNSKKGGNHDLMAQTPQEMQQQLPDLIKSSLATLASSPMMGDSVPVRDSRLLGLIYEQQQHIPLWSSQEKWLPAGDSLLKFIGQCRLYGLFPEDYHSKTLDSFRVAIEADSLSAGIRKHTGVWADADLMLTDAFIGILHDIKIGRLPNDSISMRKDSMLTDSFYLQQLGLLKANPSVQMLVEPLEPKLRDYQALKNAIPAFLATMDNRSFTKVPDPGKDKAAFKIALQKRLAEEGLTSDSLVLDSVKLSNAIKLYQKKKNLNVDGRVGEGTLRVMNTDDGEKFARIAISMDRYKLLPAEMPERYILVNTSGNYLELIERDSVKLYSKTICGKTKTRTPLLNGNIGELITYPQWVPPPSIIAKEILPAVKKNPGYLAKKGFSLVDASGEEVDPFTVDWTKYSKSMPYKVVQGSGDANALGIMKFVFSNKYSVYLHDTNQRYLFANAQRNLSHGCVRVQEWEKLALYMLKNDSLRSSGRSFTPRDSLYRWLKNKEKKSIAVRNKIPLFIRYFTCAGQDGKMLFFDDVYGEDRYLREKYYMRRGSVAVKTVPNL